MKYDVFQTVWINDNTTKYHGVQVEIMNNVQFDDKYIVSFLDVMIDGQKCGVIHKDFLTHRVADLNA